MVFAAAPAPTAARSVAIARSALRAVTLLPRARSFCNKTQSIAPLLRSMFFIPGREKLLRKSMERFSHADAWIPDMEDSVPPHEKDTARDTISSLLSELSEVGPLVVPRVNATETEWFEKDVAAVVSPHVFGISVGKVSSVEEIQYIDSVVHNCERLGDLPEGSVRTVPWIETAGGVANVANILQASPRAVAVAFGQEDYCLDMGIDSSLHGEETAFARSAVSVAARATGKLSLDSPFVQHAGDDAYTQLHINCQRARGIGFTGKCAIHPTQISPINEYFSPSPQAIKQAERIVRVFEEVEADGRASCSVDGMMVDVPVYRRALRLLDEAAKAKKGHA